MIMPRIRPFINTPFHAILVGTYILFIFSIYKLSVYWQLTSVARVFPEHQDIITMSPPQTSDNRPYMQRLADALVYVLAAPFIVFFIALKRVFTQRTEPHRSYRANLPEQKYI